VGDAFLSWDAIIDSEGDPAEPSLKTLTVIRSSDGAERGEIDVLVRRLPAREALAVHHEVVYEYQRWQPVIGWGSKYPGHLLPTDPGKWSTMDGRAWAATWEKLTGGYPFVSTHVSANAHNKHVAGNKTTAAGAAAALTAATPGKVCTLGWHTQATENDPDGWEYALDMPSPYWYTKGDAMRFMVRRRKWHRVIRDLSVQPL
jgi:hypothetical protein